MKSLKESLLDDIDVVSDNLNMKSMIKEWITKQHINNYVINDDLSISVAGDAIVKCSGSRLPEYINFLRVDGMFIIRGRLLTSLKGCPEEVGEDFSCVGCKRLTSLEGAPKKIGGEFDCSECYKLKTLKGAPEEVTYFDCSDCNELKTLEGAPRKVKKGFFCNNCKKLTSLKGSPTICRAIYSCIGCNELKTLEGAPEEVSHFNCSDCKGLTSLKGCPKKIGETFSFERCENLKSLEDGPLSTKDVVRSSQFSIIDVREAWVVSGIVY